MDEDVNSPNRELSVTNEVDPSTASPKSLPREIDPVNLSEFKLIRLMRSLY